MVLKDLRKWPGLLVTWSCLVLLLTGVAYCAFDLSVFSPCLPHSGPGARMQQVADAASDPGTDDEGLLSRVIMGEAGDEPYEGKVAVGAVMMNRMQSSAFPHTLAGVVFQPDAFESVSNGLIWQGQPTADCIRAADNALGGWDPTQGALYFWNPSKKVSAWIWTRQILTQIGNQVFAR